MNVGEFREIEPSRRIPLIADTADALRPDHSFRHHERHGFRNLLLGKSSAFAAVAPRRIRRRVCAVPRLQSLGHRLVADVKLQIETPAGCSRQGFVHVYEERRAVLRPVAPQRPCLLIEADGAKMLKTI